MTSLVSIQNFQGEAIFPYLRDLAQLRIEIFREFPYLYDGSPEYEKEYLQTYVNSPESIAVLVFDGDQLVGASTGLPLDHETDEFKKPFLKAGLDTNTIFYCGESILKKKYRGLGIYSEFMQRREKHAKSLNQFEKICFCAVSRPDDHPLRPQNYTPLDKVWNKFGYLKQENLRTFYTWKDVDQKKESSKEMIFWLKDL